MEADLSLCLFKVKSLFPHISETIEVLCSLLFRVELMVRLMEWQSESMISPHIFCDGVKRAHGCNKCSQAFSRPAHHSIGSSCSCKLQGSCILYTKVMVGHQLQMRQVINFEHPYSQVVWCWRAGNVENSQLINCLGPLP